MRFPPLPSRSCDLPARTGGGSMTRRGRGNCARRATKAVGLIRRTAVPLGGGDRRPLGDAEVIRSPSAARSGRVSGNPRCRTPSLRGCGSHRHSLGHGRSRHRRSEPAPASRCQYFHLRSPVGCVCAGEPRMRTHVVAVSGRHKPPRGQWCVRGHRTVSGRCADARIREATKTFIRPLERSSGRMAAGRASISRSLPSPQATAMDGACAFAILLRGPEGGGRGATTG